MQTAILFLNAGKSGITGALSYMLQATLLVVILGLSGGLSLCLAQPSDTDAPGTQVLTRGPVHEAFAGIISYDPEPGVVISKTPPDLIEEIPPEERPAGDNVAWIPGYWAWDDERSDFLWISGTWRALPPGREWMAGYWAQTPQGHQWISGYWADASAADTTYLPAPPASVETGPNLEAPSSDYGWTPGCWLWYRGHYAWRPGYWMQGRADWDWIPAHYVWTPRGYIFIEGYWDYAVERRGILFAPVYFETRVYSRRGYHYSPTIVISLSAFSDHLFLRPRYQHYYFGDYYASNYQEGGIYASFSFQSGRRGYDPFYSRQRWTHRNDRAWEHQVAASYQYRRDHETARPPRTWSAQIRIDSRTAEATQNRVQVAVSIDQLVKNKTGPVRFQPVARDERKQIGQRGQEVQKSREQRRSAESANVHPSAPTPGVALEPAKVQLPRSPIVAKPANKLGRNQAPPKIQPPPKPEQKSQPKAETPGRQPREDRHTPQPQSRSAEPVRKSRPARSDPAPPERQIQPVQPANDPAEKAEERSQRDSKAMEQKARQNAERQTKAEAAKNQEETKRHARELDNKARQDSEQRAQDAVQKDQENSRRNAQEREQQARKDGEQRAKAEAMKNAEEAQQRSRDLENKTRQEEEQKARVSALRAEEEALRKTQAAEQQERKERVRPERKAPAAEKEQARPTKKDQRKEEKKKQSSEDTPAP